MIDRFRHPEKLADLRQQLKLSAGAGALIAAMALQSGHAQAQTRTGIDANCSLAMMEAVCESDLSDDVVSDTSDPALDALTGRDASTDRASNPNLLNNGDMATGLSTTILARAETALLTNSVSFSTSTANSSVVQVNGVDENSVVTLNIPADTGGDVVTTDADTDAVNVFNPGTTEVNVGAGALVSGGTGLGVGIRLTGATPSADPANAILGDAMSPGGVVTVTALIADNARNLIADVQDGTNMVLDPSGRITPIATGSIDTSVFRQVVSVDNATVESLMGAGAILSEDSLLLNATNGAILRTGGDNAPVISAVDALAIIADGMTFSSAGDNAPLIALSSRDAVAGSAFYGDFTDLTASTTGANSDAIATGSGGNDVAGLIIRANDPGTPNIITTSGDGSRAISFDSAGNSEFVGSISDTMISTQGIGAAAIDLIGLDNSSLALELLNSMVSTVQDDSVVIGFTSGATSDVVLTLGNSQLSSSGDDSSLISIGAIGDGSDTEVVIVGSDLTATGDRSGGIIFNPSSNANSDRTFFLADTTITTGGVDADGIAIGNGGDASSSVTTVNARDLTIETTAASSDGFLIGARGSIGISNTDLENTFITTTGDQSRGFVLEMPRDDSATSVTVLNSSFETEGASNSAAFSIAADPLFDPTTGGASTLIFDIAGSTFSTLGSNSAGIEAPDLLGSQSFLVGTLSSLDVSTVGNNSDGVSIGTGASGGNIDTSMSFQLSAVSVDTRGDNSRGIAIDAFRLGLDGSDAFIFAQDSLVSTGGANAHAIDIAGTNGDLINADLTVALANNTLATTGDRAHGINLGRVGGNIFSANIDYAFTGNTITTSGDDAFGLFFDGFGLNSSDSGGGNSNIDIVFSMDDFDIGTAGLGSHAIRFDMSADETSLIADLVNSSITTTGDNAAGLAVSALGEDSNFGITIDATSIATQGNGANAITLGQGDRLVTSSMGLTLTNSTITSSGDSADTVLFDGLGANSIGFLTIDNSTVTAQGEGSRALAVSLPRTGSSSNIFVTNSILRSEGTSDSAAFAFLADPLFDPLANDGSNFSVNLTNSTLSTLGARSPGIVISDFLGSTVVFLSELDGVTVDTAGNDSDAITLGTGQSAGTDNVTIALALVALDLATQGDNSRGLAIDAIAGGLSDGNVTAFVQDSEITTLGDEAHAIQILNAPGDLLDSTISLVLSETNLSTAGEGAFALDIAGPQGDLEDVVLAVALGDSTLATTGDGAHGINLGRVVGEIISADIDYAFARNTVTTSGDDAYGLLFSGFAFVATTGPVGENVDIVFSMDDFDISTSGLASHALRFDMSAGRTLVPGELRNSMLTTTGDNAAGVSVSPINAPSVFGLNMDSTSISTGGTNAPGITFGEGGNIDDSIVNFTIENSTIMTTGAQSEAFRVDAPGRGAILSINLENTTFTTTGDQSRGVVLVSPSNASATTTIISGVTVNTSGASDSAAFIQSAGASFDPLTEQSSAYTINVRDSSFATVGTNSPGLLIADLLGNRSVNLVSLADTDISTMGDNSDGVAIGTGRSSGSDLNSTTISFADFSVEVDGENSRGIVIDAFRNGMESSDLSFFLQSNAITTNGDAGHGIEIGGTSGVFQTSLLTFAFLDNAITTNGDGAHGLIIGGLPEFATGDENSVLLALQFDQPLITTGAGSDGVRLGAGWGSAGAASDDRANNIESRFSSVLVADEISATGEGSVAFRTSSLINLFEISETGSITGDAAAILSEGDGGFETFTNAGTIMGDIILGDEDTTLTNTGTITGNIDLGGGANAIFVGANGRLNSLDTILLGDGNAITVEGILSPGDDGPFQTTNIGSDLVLASGSNFIVDIDGMALDPAALGFFLSDRVIVDGDITLQGGALSVASLTPEGDFDRQAQFLILDASGAVTGEFGDILADLPFLDLNLVYNPDNVILNASRQGPVVPFQSLGNTPNQIAVGAAFDQLEMGATGDLDVVIDQLIFASTPQALAAFDTNSGEIYASLLAQTAFEGLTRSREILARARRASTEGWGIWGGLGGSDSTVDGDGNGADVDASAFGFDLGMDYTGPGNGWAVGVAGGSRNGDLEIEDRASEADYDSWYLSGYGRYGTGGQGPTISAALSYTQADDIAVTRGISVAALNRNALGTTDADVFTLGAEARYGVSLSGNWAAGPVGSITLVEADLGTVRETGAQSLNLSSRGSDENQTIFGIGAFVNWQKGMSAFDLSAQYVDGGTNRAEAVLAFEGAPDAPFTIRAPRASNDGLLASVSGQIELGAGWSLGAQVDGFFGNDFDDVTGSAVVSWRF